MKKRTLILFCMAALFLAVPGSASAAPGEKPAQFAFVDPWQVFDRHTSIGGFRFNLLYGYNKNITGLDFGLVNRASGNVSGIEIGAVNLVEGDFVGWQSSVANFTEGDFMGLQTGFFNSAAQKMSGVQVGFYNVAGTLDGMQFGLINFNNARKPLYFLPVVNFSF
ncbi:MAG: hypothetical protein C0613_13380 [Desulfobulbaceae bacterium]|nr:MAG: hypothetical protein C0613_13380 [Desulfobulbaceae bacterium]